MNIIRNGVILLTYLFIIVCLYIFLSSPFDNIVTSLNDVNMSASDTQVDAAVATSRTIFNMIFAGLAIVPILWFIVWIFHTEPDWRYR